MSDAFLVPVIYGSVRTERQGIRAARFLVAALKQCGHEPVLVDPMEKRLPLLDKMYKEFEPGTAPPPMEELADLFRRADGFIIVSGEYNQGIPPALKNLLDHFLEEYFWRPAGIATYSGGRFSGVRAGVQLRTVLGELGMVTIPTQCPYPTVGKTFAEDGTTTEDWIVRQTAEFITEFEWYARALKAQRASGVPT
jgi:NAD(P)H-dependent FMN reductase